ncbi:uncharacterized protein MONOS_2816 [Monocercomonoides exilis]|uniref:uncharacterized protein n=1 Tax=Monocercomonoides exilis TaxID=2049356 RepID=UPI00355961A1|nr:hypothetical protein MONOS_2816 [Monocercomonoides exilis]|eukprot:MONOS_2816.1-p1 / transcript=MONOS_2816.1 / gene=MONOS_2816 / organism=Monocercomonoides_exilis_PA203 / gene_product=unspecified product / transcript_product=unspecified product / location=Mono_scaffold00060:107609-109631(+) / protein_length=342 / sequence_SO=supercontig / SO=protein_coding / is_pseudo=false
MRTVSWSLRQVDHETAHELWIPITLHSSVQMKRLLKPLKIGLKSSLVLKLTKILGIFGDKIATDLEEGIAVLAEAVVPRQQFGYFVFMWLRVKHAAQKKSEAAQLKMIFVVELFLKDFADVLLLKKFEREECKGDKLCLVRDHVFEARVSFVRVHSADTERAVSVDLSGYGSEWPGAGDFGDIHRGKGRGGGGGGSETADGVNAVGYVEDRRAAGTVVDGWVGCGVGGTAAVKNEVEKAISTPPSVETAPITAHPPKDHQSKSPFFGRSSTASSTTVIASAAPSGTTPTAPLSSPIPTVYSPLVASAQSIPMPPLILYKAHALSCSAHLVVFTISLFKDCR